MCLHSVKSQADSSKKTLDEFEVTTTRVGEKSPVAHENISKEEIEVNNHGVDLPILLDQATSVVTTSDAGAGVGYTGIRIRGTDATRVNVTVNGIPFNDAESQGVYWVNMPDISSSTDDIQIQRGVGASTTGSSAFGASINLSTLSTVNSNNPYGEISNSFGSFNTLKNTVKLGTGLIDGKWNFEGRLSKITSNGFIDRSSSNLNSYYLSGSYLGEKIAIQALAFSGHEITNQAWYGAPLSYLNEDSVQNYNPTYNPYDYDKEVDNYSQTHYQLHFTNKPTKKLKLNASLHYTKGGGYFEQYVGTEYNSVMYNSDYVWGKDLFSYYGLEDVVLSGDTISQTNLIRRRWLDNHFYGIVYSAEYDNDNFNFIIGGGANQYLGGHFGEVIWAQYSSNGNIRHRYYDNDATKNDVNVYGKFNYSLNSDFNAYVDLQYRYVSYDFVGLDTSSNPINTNAKMSFFNPKFGFNYNVDKKSSFYAFTGLGNKEPNRDDFTESSPLSRPTHESLLDIEFGYRYNSQKLIFTANVYNMQYENQLILTGELNDVGSAVRVNVPVSFRRGIEFTGAVKLMDNLTWRINTTLSQNKIDSFNKYVDNWDTGGMDEEIYSNTDIAFSPSIIAGSQLIFSPISSSEKGKLDFAFISKYVGEQYIDNTSSDYAKLEDYFVHDLRINYSIKNIEISAWIRNLLNQNYISNAWVYRFNTSYDPTTYDPYANSAGGTNQYNQIGAFNQAGINFFIGVNFKF